MSDVDDRDLRAVTDRIRACRHEVSAANRVLVDEALASKWEGVQSVALQVLGTWGDDGSRRRLRDFIERVDERPHGWAIRGVAVRALSGCVTRQDAAWALDRLFSLEGVLAKHEFVPVVLALPPDAVRGRLVQESVSPDRDNRQAAMKALGNMDVPDRQRLLRHFLEDDDADIRRGARALLGHGA